MSSSERTLRAISATSFSRSSAERSAHLGAQPLDHRRRLVGEPRERLELGGREEPPLDGRGEDEHATQTLSETSGTNATLFAPTACGQPRVHVRRRADVVDRERRPVADDVRDPHRSRGRGRSRSRATTPRRRRGRVRPRARSPRSSTSTIPATSAPGRPLTSSRSASAASCAVVACSSAASSRGCGSPSSGSSGTGPCSPSVRPRSRSRLRTRLRPPGDTAASPTSAPSHTAAPRTNRPGECLWGERRTVPLMIGGRCLGGRPIKSGKLTLAEVA